MLYLFGVLNFAGRMVGVAYSNVSGWRPTRRGRVGICFKDWKGPAGANSSTRF